MKKISLLIIFLFCLPLFSSLLLQEIPQSKATSPLSRLHTDGKYIKDQWNQVVYLRGAALGELSWKDTYKVTNMTDWLYNMTSQTNNKANFIRLCIANSNVIGSLENPEYFFSEVDRVKDACVTLGIYFITNWHGDANLTQTQAIEADNTALINWHLAFVNRYKNVPNFIGVEVWNEINKYNFANVTHIYDIMKHVYESVYAVDPTLLTFVTTDQFVFVDWDDTYPLLGPQAVYCWIDYPHHFPTIVTTYATNVTQGYIDLKTLLENPSNSPPTYDGKQIGGNGNYPVFWMEGGFQPSENIPLQMVDDWFKILSDNNNGWADYMWWGSAANYGLYNSTTTLLDANGLIWASYLTGTPEEPYTSPVTPSGTYQVYGIGFEVYIPTNNLLGFQDTHYIGYSGTPQIIYINVTSGNLNSTSCEVAIYNNYQGFFKFTALEACSIHIYFLGGPTTFKKNGVTFNGYTSVTPSETITLSWILSSNHIITIQNGIHGTASPLGTFSLLHGSTITITATPTNASYLFIYWQVVGSNRIGQNPYTLVATKDLTIYPVFKAVGGVSAVSVQMTFILPMVVLLAIAGFTVVLARSRRN